MGDSPKNTSRENTSTKNTSSRDIVKRTLTLLESTCQISGKTVSYSISSCYKSRIYKT